MSGQNFSQKKSQLIVSCHSFPDSCRLLVGKRRLWGPRHWGCLELSRMWLPASHLSLKLDLTWNFTLLCVGGCTIRGHIQIKLFCDSERTNCAVSQLKKKNSQW